MPVLDVVRRRAIGRRWYANRRAEWIAENGPCVRCRSTENLQVDHIDPAQKVSHRVWSWTERRRQAELAKCQVLCAECHKAKTREEIASRAPCGTRARYVAGCRCSECRAANAAYARDLKARQVPAAVGRPFTAEARQLLDAARWTL